MAQMTPSTSLSTGVFSCEGAKASRRLYAQVKSGKKSEWCRAVLKIAQSPGLNFLRQNMARVFSS